MIKFIDQEGDFQNEPWPAGKKYIHYTCDWRDLH